MTHFLKKVEAQGGAVDQLRAVLGDKGFDAWLKRRGSRKAEAVEHQARCALDNMRKAAEKKLEWEKLCDDLEAIVESPDTFFGDTEEEVEEERARARTQLEELKGITQKFPLFSSNNRRKIRIV